MVSDSEQPGGRVIAALRQYGSFVNGARRRPTVPGADLAAFVRQRARGETGETSVVKLSGVVVRGSLDLGGLCESEGESRLLELVFEDCHFDAPIILTNANILRLSLERSQLQLLDAIGLRTLGNVHLASVRAFTGQECMIRLSQATIGGALNAEAAQLSGVRSETGRDFALHLNRAHVTGGILASRLRARGGLRLQFLQVGAPIDLTEARLAAGAEGLALNGEGLRASGLWIDKTVAAGPVVLTDARIDGAVSAARLRVRAGRRRIALDLASMNVSAYIDLSDIRLVDAQPFDRDALPLLRAPLLRAGADVYLNGASFRCSAWQPAADLRSAQIEGELALGNLSFNSTLCLEQLKCAANIQLGIEDGSRATGPVEAQGVEVGGRLSISGEIEGGVNLRSGIVTGSTMLSLGPSRDWVPAVQATGFSCDQDMVLELRDPGTTAQLDGMRIRGNLYVMAQGDMTNAHLERGITEAVNAPDLEIGRNIVVTGRVAGSLNLRRAQVRGDIIFGKQGERVAGDQGLRISSLAAPTRIDLADGQIGGQIRLYGRMSYAIELFCDENGTPSVMDVRVAELPFYPGWTCADIIWQRSGRAISTPLLWDSDNAIVFLRGTATEIYNFNEYLCPPRLTLDTVPAYVAFLTGMLEGSEGRMRIIEQDPPVADTLAWDVRLALAYGGARIDCKARIDQSGKLSFSEQSVSQMTEQSSAGEFKGPLGHRFADRADALAPLFDADWTSLDAVRRDLLVRQCMSAAFPVSDLSGLECAALNDQDGALWGEDARLLLEGISVRRFVEMRGRALGNSTSRRLSGMRDSQSGATARVAWLGRQVQSRIQDWSPQPYEAFARVYRLHGFADEANIVLAEKARRDIKKQRSRMWPGLRQLFGPIYEAALVTFWGGLFRYGLSPTRALATCAAFLLVGWIGVEAANHGQPLPMLGLDFSGSGPPALELSLTPVQGVAVAGENSLGIEVVPGSAVRTSIPCGQAIDTWIYATDVFIPLLDLREEGICSIRSDAWARPWRIAKAVYAALGWLVLSLTVITLSAPLRRNTGE